jgi:hypothetical protein
MSQNSQEPLLSIDTAAIPKFASDVQETAFRVRKAGLEIYKIQDLDL